MYNLPCILSLFFRLSSTVVNVFALLHVTNKIALEAKRHALCVQLQKAFVLFRVLTKLLVHPFLKSFNFFTENASNCRLRETRLYCFGNPLAAWNSKDVVGWGGISYGLDYFCVLRVSLFAAKGCTNSVNIQRKMMLRLLCDFRVSYSDRHPYYGNEKFISGQ